MRRFVIVPFVVLLACAGPASQASPTVEPAQAPPPIIEPSRLPNPTLIVSDTQPAGPIVPPAEAYARGWMPLGATGVDQFATRYPAYDGRGVLLGILDSGVDPGVPGVARSTAGVRLLDLRDFSDEGRVALVPLKPRGDTALLGSHALAGLSRLAAYNRTGPWYIGALAEIPLGKAPAADFNGNGTVGDSLLLVVTRATDGWVVFADTDGDGTLANERPVRDYLQGRETFAWKDPSGGSPIAVAVNLSEASGKPELDLVFDTSGHGTHVTGIAAGNDLYGVKGFDGVAPGVQLLGLKIANNAYGGITTSGSMLRAIDYAVRFAKARQLPLVLNMSFGVGNEEEGAPPIDRMIDSVLAANPDVVFTVSAGNDGPGLSTMGFPGSASRIISVGALYPSAFLPPRVDGSPQDERVAFFSSRGGELARPHIIAPGMAYSSVPPWDVGNEDKSGTSMASPHAAGLAARLVSAMVQERRPYRATSIRQALMVSARPAGQASVLDEGAGIPDLVRALEWLREGHPVADIRVDAVGHGVDAAFRPKGLRGAGDTVQTFRLSQAPTDHGMPETYSLSSDAAWLVAPDSVRLADTAVVAVRYRPERLATPGVHTGVVSGYGPDREAGPMFRLLNTVVVPYPVGAPVRLTTTVPAGETVRLPFATDSARPFSARVGTVRRGLNVIAFLHEPGGMPARGGHGQSGGYGDQAALFDVDGRDAVGGVYELVAVAQPGTEVPIVASVDHAPFRLSVQREFVDRNDKVGHRVAATVTSLAADSLQVITALALVGAERTVLVSGTGSVERRQGFTLPAWARRVVVDVHMDRDQWPMFTDFGVTLAHADGRIIETSPLNYAFGRLEAAVEEGTADQPVELILSPGLAVPRSTQAWSLRMSIRLYADQPVLVDAAEEGVDHFSLLRAGRHRIAFEMPVPPWPIGPGFFPLGYLIAETGQRIWSREVPLPPAPPPVQP